MALFDLLIHSSAPGRDISKRDLTRHAQFDSHFLFEVCCSVSLIEFGIIFSLVISLDFQFTPIQIDP
jgi:hypothetical protein